MPGRDQRSRNKVDHRGGGRGTRSGKKYVEEDDFDAIARRNRDVEQIKRRQEQQLAEEGSSSDDDEPTTAPVAAHSKMAPEVKTMAKARIDSDDDIAPIGADQKHQPTRREREAAAKEAAHKAYLEKQAKGETSEFKAQARRLAEVRARREAAANKREAEEAAGITGNVDGGSILGVQAGREPPNRPSSALAEAMGATSMTAGPKRRGGGKKGKH
ncbi:28 kDa heat- and acid-stable phosphoprotein, putative [Perkinsus marinus ATCC 50983]|uniref:28 kDa heat-and acid-stable phosphoprotein, putative n=1 Tax=Perkinsus marinus (strain ATCC 50983 / TXsc) TaxID=423536 RepID=C5KTD9_PERM5|nr:28 kDa heat- and acid-stable phosphoprotein, putative [Perkinsus marinus ATCC 50983]EER12244.1 28 kDa heat- and acid-stable phosphoprotein, putative [Perkinsus marinus ATCC 50983]|eukprot:XP_002780449.1 28 kDa heat- and acid-stable phosphoprotein, putative [Perkinsus marinus ATCC 50983]